MSKEIKHTVTLNVKNGDYNQRFSANGTIDQAVQGAQSGIVFVGTSEEDMPVGDVATNGILAIHNLDAANYVDYGPKSAGNMVAFGRLAAGEVHLLRLKPGVTLRWIADTATVKVDMLLNSN